MKPVRISILCALLALTPRSLAQERIERASLDPAPKEALLPEKPVILPMTREFGWAVIEASINGRGPYHLVFDTGAPGLLLTNKAAKALDLPPVDGMGHGGVEVRVAGPGGPGVSASLHQVHSLKLAEAEFRELSAIATTLPMPADIAGVLGMGVLRDALVTIDYPAGQFRLERGELPPANGKDILDFVQTSQRGSHPAVKVDVCGSPVDFILDTGMSGWFRFNKEVTERCALLQGPVAGPLACSVDKQMPTQAVRLAGTLAIGGQRFETPQGILNEMDVGPLVGGRALDRFSVALDQVHHRVRFTRQDPTPIIPPPMRTVGFRPRRGEDGYEVWNLTPGSPADQAGLKDSVVLVSLNNRPVEEFYSAAAWDKLLEAQKLRIRYKPREGGEEREIEITVDELLPVPGK